MTDVLLQAIEAVAADDEPQFQRTEPLAEWNLPMLQHKDVKENQLAYGWTGKKLHAHKHN